MTQSEARREIDSRERFAFGRNWRGFVRIIDPSKVEAAEASLIEKLGDLKGLQVVDVGCGSGLFSLAARNLGATVTSFDFDPESVRCAELLRDRFRPDDPNWKIEAGSILDTRYLQTLGKFDLVYSWGVLHHTGDMWAALENVVQLVSRRGKVLIAIYNDQGVVTRFWMAVKQYYVRSGTVGRRMVLATLGNFLAARSTIVDWMKRRPSAPRRGMDRRVDIVDWIGGWPFEVAAPDLVVRFYETRGFAVLATSYVGRRMGNNEFLFRRT